MHEVRQRRLSGESAIGLHEYRRRNWPDDTDLAARIIQPAGATLMTARISVRNGPQAIDVGGRGEHSDRDGGEHLCRNSHGRTCRGPQPSRPSTAAD